MRALLWCVLVAGVLQASGALARGSALLVLPFETTRPESFILHGAATLAQGHALYPPLGPSEPWALHVYNPLTYLPAAAAGWLFSLSYHGITVTGRLVAFVSHLGLGLLCGAFVLRTTRSWKPALFATIAPWCFHLATATDFFRLRPESPALLFTLAGALAVMSRMRRAWLAAAASFFVAFLFKQSFVAAPVATALYLASTHRRDALRFCAAYGGCVALFLLLMLGLTGSGYFEHTVLSMALNEVRPLHQLLQHGPAFVAVFWGPLLALVPALVIVACSRCSRHARFLFVYLGVSSAWTLYSFGKVGAGLYYFCEWSALVLLIEAIALAVATEGAHAGWRSTSVLGPVAAHVAFVAGVFGPAGAPIHAPEVDISAQVAHYQAIDERCLITHEAIAIHSGHVVAFDWFLLDLLRDQGLFSAEPLLAAVRRGEYAVVALNRSPTSRLEVDIFHTLRESPYRPGRADPHVLEWLRAPSAQRARTTVTPRGPSTQMRSPANFGR